METLQARALLLGNFIMVSEPDVEGTIFSQGRSIFHQKHRKNVQF